MACKQQISSILTSLSLQNRWYIQRSPFISHLTYYHNLSLTFPFFSNNSNNFWIDLQSRFSENNAKGSIRPILLKFYLVRPNKLLLLNVALFKSSSKENKERGLNIHFGIVIVQKMKRRMVQIISLSRNSRLWIHYFEYQKYQAGLSTAHFSTFGCFAQISVQFGSFWLF